MRVASLAALYLVKALPRSRGKEKLVVVAVSFSVGTGLAAAVVVLGSSSSGCCRVLERGRMASGGFAAVIRTVA